jgi:hypothetical protein
MLPNVFWGTLELLAQFWKTLVSPTSTQQMLDEERRKNPNRYVRPGLPSEKRIHSVNDKDGPIHVPAGKHSFLLNSHFQVEVGEAVVRVRLLKV